MRYGDQLPLDLPTFTNGGVILLALVIVAGVATPSACPRHILNGAPLNSGSSCHVSVTERPRTAPRSSWSTSTAVT